MPPSDRQDRLAAALRENLRKRKDQSRNRRASEDDGTSGRSEGEVEAPEADAREDDASGKDG